MLSWMQGFLGIEQLQLPEAEVFYRTGLIFVRVLLILTATAFITRVIRRSLKGVREHLVTSMIQKAGGPNIELEKRATTIVGIFSKAATVVVWAAAIVISLDQLGLNIGPILAGAGVVGLAVGFGAQNLVKDVISGLFLLVENQIRVNDVAVINGTGGLVEEINLRTTVLRSQDGTVHVFPNGSIERLSNMTRMYSYYVFDIGVAYKEDTDRVIEVVKELGARMIEEEAYKDAILEPLEVLGVDRFENSAVIIRARFKTQPIKQWMVGREMNRRIKKKFDEVGIEIPFPHQTVYWGEAVKPLKLETGAGRDEIRQVVREVLVELGNPGNSGGGDPVAAAPHRSGPGHAPPGPSEEEAGKI
jgi:moderate conductance mechanosensitive channel